MYPLRERFAPVGCRRQEELVRADERFQMLLQRRMLSMSGWQFAADRNRKRADDPQSGARTVRADCIGFVEPARADTMAEVRDRIATRTRALRRSGRACEYIRWAMAAWRIRCG